MISGTENHEFNMKFKAFKIDINSSDISDIVAAKKHDFVYEFKNKANNKAGGTLKEVVRTGKRFIVINERHLVGQKGFYVKYIPELDVLALVVCSLNIKEDDSVYWVEDGRYFISKEGYTCEETVVTDMYLRIDICGQTIADFVNLGTSFRWVQPSGATNAVVVFLGGLMIKRMSGEPFIYDFSKGEDFKALFDIFSNERRRTRQDKFYDYFYGEPIIYTGMLLENNERYEIPKEAMETMNKYAAAQLKEMLNGYLLPNNFTEEVPYTFSIVQNVNGQTIQRVFYPVYCLNNTGNSQNIKLIECLDIKLDSVFMQRVSKVKHYMESVVVYCDDNIDGMYKYTADFLRTAVSIFSESFKAYGFYKGIAFTDSEINETYGIAFEDSVKALFELTMYPIFEKLFKMDDAYKELAKIVFEDAVMSSGASSLKNNFGITYHQKNKVHEILGMPKGLLEYCAKELDICAVRYIKKAFSINEETVRYFTRLNKSDMEILIKFTTNAKDCISGIWEKAFMMLRSMIKIWGVESWKQYVNHLEKIMADKKINISEWDDYCGFIEYLSTIESDIACEVDWKLRGEDVEKTYDKIVVAQGIKNVKDYDNVCKAFKDKAEIWSKYEFEDDNFKIVLPSSPEDIIKEGVILKHCVKEFPNIIASGESTVLFIRKKENLRKPYFTLEIRNDEVRQCHGKCNSNVRDDKLMIFLYEFEKQMGMQKTLGFQALGL